MRNLTQKIVMALLAVSLVDCTAHVGMAFFPKTAHTILPGSLQGPFSGYVVDSQDQPLGKVTVVGCWSYEFSPQQKKKPEEVCEKVTTPNDGSYLFKKLTLKKDDAATLTRFHLTAYKVGYVGYRSDAYFGEMAKRQDFVQFVNRIELSPFPLTKKHQDHLAFFQGIHTLRADLEQERKLAEEEKIPPPQPLPEPPKPSVEPSKPASLPIETWLRTAVRSMVQGRRTKKVAAKIVPVLESSQIQDVLNPLDPSNPVPKDTKYFGVSLEKENQSLTAILFRMWDMTTAPNAKLIYTRFRNGFKNVPEKIDPKTKMHWVHATNAKSHLWVVAAYLPKSKRVVQLLCGNQLCKHGEEVQKILFSLQKQMDAAQK